MKIRVVEVLSRVYLNFVPYFYLVLIGKSTEVYPFIKFEN